MWWDSTKHVVALTIQRLSGKVSRLLLQCAQPKQLLRRLTELAAEIAAAGDVEAIKKHSKHKRRCPVCGVSSEQNRIGGANRENGHMVNARMG